MASVRSIGLTGGIGSGKSTVARVLISYGAVLVDTDVIARELTSPGGIALPALVAQFGADIVAADGALDRDRMRSLAFSDASAKRRLESVLHPMIGVEAMRQAATAAGSVVVFDVPLLTADGPWRARVDRVLVVDCDESTQIERVMQRSGWTREAVQRVIDQQATRGARCAIADAVICNIDLTLQALEREVQMLWQQWQARWQARWQAQR